MRYLLGLLLLIAVLTGCNSHNSGKEAVFEKSTNDPQAIIDKAIAAHGGDKFLQLQVAFDFRDKHYEASRQDGLYSYTRSFTDSTGQVKDVLTNKSFTRTINGQVKDLPAERVKAFSASVNSVIYFALLPFGLNDPAVQKQYLGSATIKQIPYHKIKVTFKQEGGGTDFQDEFLYFINQKSFTMDYFAYTYVTDGGGIRFRQAINPRKVEGILFQDYINFEPLDTINFWKIEQAFTADQLKELSNIELKNIRINILH
ncbi:MULTISPECIES: DUF6503 family protein [Adhaeribacter]|uniref:Deoxyribose-phosphate aldolase n=2 Tax=Adhaeribacter TaxID=299566 RepID=A0A512B5R2_9BACT|nr:MULTISPECIES: DUF6503 family protein [Adhaeribacter]KAA5542044.1 hypothetical protein F0145_19850 [Adhaeribacter rhizoryzae]GEO07300.1 hypothetical protein AAE02nite_49640 [Adhaeribacter aerolatus]